MLRFRDLRVDGDIDAPKNDDGGIMSSKKGRRVLPDLPTAILARIRGYVGGGYPKPLTGDAAKLGYHPLSSASPEEMEQIQAKMDEIMGGENEWSES